MAKKELNDNLDMMFEAAMARTEEWGDIYRDGLDYLFNNQLAGRPVKDNDPRIQMNQLLPAMKQALAVIAQRRVKPVVNPVEPLDTDAAKNWQAILGWQYKTTLDMNSRLIEASLDGLVLGHYISKTTWNDKWKWDSQRTQWLGQPRVVIIDPRLFGVDPDSETFQGANYLCTRRQIPVAEAIQKWPKHEAKILQAADSDTLQKTGYKSSSFAPNYKDAGQKDLDTDGGVEGRLVHLLNKRFDDAPSEVVTDSKMAGYVVVEEMFWQDYSEKEQTIEERISQAPDLAQTDSQSLETAQATVRKVYQEPTYPFGRYVIRIRAGNTYIILNDADDKQIWPYTQWPFALGRTMPLPHTWQGMNIVEGARGLQDWMNINANALASHTELYANPMIKVEPTALVGGDDNSSVADLIQPGPGAIVKFQQGRMGGMAVETPPQLSQATFQFHQMLEEAIRDTTGIQDIMLGKSPGGRATAVEVQQLQINSQLTTSLASILRDEWTIDTLNRVLELNQRNMSPGQQIDIAGSDMRVTVSPHMLSHFYDLALDLTAALPFDSALLQQKYLTLYSTVSPALGDPTFMLEPLLNSFEIPDAEKWVKQAQEIMQAAQQQATNSQESGTPEPGL